MTSGPPVWGSKSFLLLTITTLVIANYHRHDDNSYAHSIDNFQHPYNNSRLNEDTKFRHHIKMPHLRHQHAHRGPYFENADGKEINETHKIVHLGDDALLDCRVVMLSGKMVLWLRESPERTFLLTIGEGTHIENPRYSVRFKYPNNWRLSISSIQKEDRGSYVCQVNTHPPRILKTNVTILAPDIRIVDEAGHQLQDRYYKTGSVIELWCIVRQSRPGSRVPHPVWKKNNDTLPEQVNIYHTNGSNNEIVTAFQINHATKSDSGEYLCTIGQFSTSLVVIHVLNGEKQAAVHHDQWNTAMAIRFDFAALFVEFIIFLLFRTSSTFVS